MECMTGPYKNNPILTLLWMNLQGKTGSLTPLSLVTFHSQNINVTQRIPDKPIKPPTRPLFQGCLRPAFSSAATRNTEAARRRKAPRKSILSKIDFARAPKLA
jgi:hypothetical protein